MRIKNIWLILISASIWGSTWYVIKFQLGLVDPLVSVVYRHLLAGILLLSYCAATGVNLRFSKQQHLFMVLQGVLLFGFCYWFAYQSEVYVTSGLLAVAFSGIVFLNAFFGRIFIKRPLNKKVLVAALAGLSGTALIFWNELSALNFSTEVYLGLSLAMVSVTIASLGNITSARNSASGIPVLQGNGFSMLYGAVLMAILALILGKEFTVEYSVNYFASLAYLTVFGSITAFGAYLTLIHRIGADRAAYTLVVIPIISIAISMVFENYVMSWLTWAGIALILLGNLLALRK